MVDNGIEERDVAVQIPLPSSPRRNGALRKRHNRTLLGQRSHAAQADLGLGRRGAAVHGHEDRGRRAGRRRHQQLRRASPTSIVCRSTVNEATLAPVPPTRVPALSAVWADPPYCSLWRARGRMIIGGRSATSARAWTSPSFRVRAVPRRLSDSRGCGTGGRSGAWPRRRGGGRRAGGGRLGYWRRWSEKTPPDHRPPEHRSTPHLPPRRCAGRSRPASARPAAAYPLRCLSLLIALHDPSLMNAAFDQNLPCGVRAVRTR